MSLRELFAALFAQLGDSLLAFLNFLEALVKAVVGRIASVAAAASILILWLLAFQHADTVTGPVLLQLRDTALALLREAQAGAENRTAALKPPSVAP